MNLDRAGGAPLEEHLGGVRRIRTPPRVASCKPAASRSSLHAALQSAALRLRAGGCSRRAEEQQAEEEKQEPEKPTSQLLQKRVPPKAHGKGVEEEEGVEIDIEIDEPPPSFDQRQQQLERLGFL